MFRYNLIIAFRNLIRYPSYAALNIVGFSVGVATAIVIVLFVRHETHFDAFRPNAERIVRISQDFHFPNGPARHVAGMPPAAAPLLKLDFPQVEAAARLAKCGSKDGGALISGPKASGFDPGYASADAELFQIFDFGWLKGNSATALSEPTAIVLTQAAARRYFGSGDPMGQTLRVENGAPLKVTGVIRDLPANSHFQFSMLSSMLLMRSVLGPQALQTWDDSCFHTYVLLRKASDAAALQAQAGAFFDRRQQPQASLFLGFTATPLLDIHLLSHREGEMRPPGSTTTVYAFSVIAGLILLIACINFVNLTTARAAQRAVEVGMRKALGASHGQLILQFMGESLLLIAVSTGFALALVAYVLPAFPELLGASATSALQDELYALLTLGGVTLLLGILAGSYPALYLSAFQPAAVLGGDLTRGRSAGLMRKSLVAVQFAASIGLILATLVVYQQIRFARAVELGYDKEHLLVLSGSPTVGLGKEWSAMRHELQIQPGVLAVTASGATPGMPSEDLVSIQREGSSQQRDVWFLKTDVDFFETYKIKMLSGRRFVEADRMVTPSSKNPQGYGNFVLNESAVRVLGLNANSALGQRITLFGAISGPIVGVVRDFHFESVRERIKPTLYVLAPIETQRSREIRYASIRVQSADLERTLGQIDAVWKRFVPEQPIWRHFLSEDLDALYREDIRQGGLLAAFSGLAIFVCALGVLGLAGFMVRTRTREIGVRRALGGGTWGIIQLFTREFTWLVLIAGAVACPLSYVLLDSWLSGFAYRTSIPAAAVIASVCLTLLLSWIVVAAVAFRAAQISPAVALRHE